MSAKHRIVMIAGDAINLDFVTWWRVIYNYNEQWVIRVVFQNNDSIDIISNLESEELARRVSDSIFNEIEEDDDTVIGIEELESIIQYERDFLNGSVSTEEDSEEDSDENTTNEETTNQTVELTSPPKKSICWLGYTFFFEDLLDIKVVNKKTNRFRKDEWAVVGVFNSGAVHDFYTDVENERTANLMATQLYSAFEKDSDTLYNHLRVEAFHNLYKL